MNVFVLVFVTSLCQLASSPCHYDRFGRMPVYIMDKGPHYPDHFACAAAAHRLNRAAEKTAIKGDPRLYALCVRAEVDDEL